MVHDVIVHNLPTTVTSNNNNNSILVTYYIHYQLINTTIPPQSTIKKRIKIQHNEYEILVENASTTDSITIQLNNCNLIFTQNNNTTTTTTTTSTTTTTNAVALPVGGYHKEKQILFETISNLLINNIKIYKPTGLVVYGGKGYGKHYFVKQNILSLNNNNKISILELNAFEYLNRSEYGMGEKLLKQYFDHLLLNNKQEEMITIVIINEIELLCMNTNNSSSSSESTKRLSITFSTILDQIYLFNNNSNSNSNNNKILIIGITDNIESVNYMIRRSGRLDREIELAIPSRDDRFEILTIMLQHTSSSSNGSMLTNNIINYLADRTHGFIVSDLKLLCNEIMLEQYSIAMECNLSLADNEQEQREQQYTLLDQLISKVKPSAIREIVVEVPHVKWEDIGGQLETKQLLREYIQWQLKDEFSKMGLRAPKGVLLYGPPGNSKTMLAKALATEAGLNFIAIRGPELFSKWVGDSEKAVRQVFQRARKAKPCIIFFDEIDALAVERGHQDNAGVGDRVLSQLLNELDGLDRLEGVIILAATNRPDILDKALVRPGRFDRMIHVRMPDEQTRSKIFEIYLKKVDPCCLQQQMTSGGDSLDELLQWLGKRTEGYSGAECVALCREAAYLCLRQNPTNPQLTQTHFSEAMLMVTPRISPQLLQFYEEFENSRK